MGSTDADVPLNPESMAPSDENLTRTSRSNLQSYVWMNNDSMLSRNVDRWIGGDIGSPTHASLQPNERASASPTQPRPEEQLLSSGFWYVAALMLPLLTYNGAGGGNWRCSPSALLNTAELLLTQVSGFCARARSRLRRVAHNHGARDLFAGAMDVVLVVYAFGFLLISLYQASIFHQIE